MPINVSFVLLLCLFFASGVHQFSPIWWLVLVVLQGIRSRWYSVVFFDRTQDVERWTRPPVMMVQVQGNRCRILMNGLKRQKVEKLSVRNDRQSHTKHRPRGHRGEDATEDNRYHSIVLQGHTFVQWLVALGSINDKCAQGEWDGMSW